MFILSRESLGMRLHRAGPEIKDRGGIEQRLVGMYIAHSWLWI